MLKSQLNWLIFIDHCPFLLLVKSRLSAVVEKKSGLLRPINTAKLIQPSFGSILTEIVKVRFFSEL